MERKTKEIKREFSKFVVKLQLNLERNGAINLSAIVTNIIAYDSKLKKVMSRCASIPEVVQTLVLPQYSTFLEYDLIKVLVQCGSNEIQGSFTEYKTKLQKFLEGCLIKQPIGEGFAVVLERSITDECIHLDQLQNKIRIILGYPELTFVRLENLHKAPALPVQDDTESYTETATLQAQASGSDCTTVTTLSRNSQSDTSKLHSDEILSSGTYMCRRRLRSQLTYFTTHYNFFGRPSVFT